MKLHETKGRESTQANETRLVKKKKRGFWTSKPTDGGCCVVIYGYN